MIHWVQPTIVRNMPNTLTCERFISPKDLDDHVATTTSFLVCMGQYRHAKFGEIWNLVMPKENMRWCSSRIAK
jgi:hypothetical protein